VLLDCVGGVDYVEVVVVVFDEVDVVIRGLCCAYVVLVYFM